MKAISFGWTTLPLLAGVKTVTRREWKDTFAARWHQGEQFWLLDKDYRYGGVRLGVGELTETPVKQLACDAPAGDFAAEGFAWFDQHPEMLTPAFRVRLAKAGGLRGFLRQHELMWVVRFRVVEWHVDPAAELDRRM
ncbi:MAG: hypothetical protein M0R75_15970, partial [Dehalococcoidia bacterium]|nr:hypothetical protein [Dehalococcoidia bacterium]